MNGIIDKLDHYAGLLETAAKPAPSRSIQDDLDNKGWSLVRIDRIADEPVVIAYDRSLPGIPAGYAVYTADELERIDAIESSHTIALIHAAKKAGAELITEKG